MRGNRNYRQLATVAASTLPAAPAAAGGAFGLDLMRAQPPGNVVLSPDSVAAALAMTGTGAVGRTAGETANTLHLRVQPVSVPLGISNARPRGNRRLSDRAIPKPPHLR